MTPEIHTYEGDDFVLWEAPDFKLKSVGIALTKFSVLCATLGAACGFIV